MSQEDVDRLDEDEAAVEEKDEDDSPDAEGHGILRGAHTAHTDPGAHTAHTDPGAHTAHT
ncbi:MAG TPA: hypothetical protein VHX66_07355 [Solirubrobacteraceae bacterium]|nr:hypothetical protein [Solirubrobacteraceae bacterium]